MAKSKRIQNPKPADRAKIRSKQTPVGKSNKPKSAPGSKQERVLGLLQA